MAPVPSWFRWCARVRGMAALLALPLLVVGIAGLRLLGGVGWNVLYLVAIALLVAGLALSFLPLPVAAAPVAVAPPVRGRWTVIHSPADRVPSHRTHALGQTWAVDLVHDPDGCGERRRPEFGQAAFRDPRAFPGFGREVLAPADGTVVAAYDRARDHRSRTTWPAVAYMMVEGALRELLGPRRLLGNHVVLDLGGGVFAALAHLQRGSAAVAMGDRVRAGELIGRCGNSGNSSEPHLHLQLMDHHRPALAAGVPLAFRLPGAAVAMPGEGQPLVS